MALTIAEPATTLTDYLMACLAACFAAVLGGRGQGAGHTRWWSRAFAFLAASALAGGTCHGFQGSVPPWVAAGLWRATLAAASLSSYATMRAVALQWLASDRSSFWTRIAVVKLAASLVAGSLRPVFAVVVLDFGLTTPFAACAAIVGRARNPRAFVFLSAGVVLFTAGAMIQQAGLSPHPAFNHNDLSHVLQILGNTCFFLSAWLGRPRLRPRG